MDQTRSLFLAGANVVVHWLFRELALNLEPSVSRIAIPLESLPRGSEPVVEFHPEFKPALCRDENLLNDLRALGRLDNSWGSAEIAYREISSAISKCAEADQFVHFCSHPVIVDEHLACVILQLNKAACDQKYGTTFIISRGAIQEAERLQDQCFRLTPLLLTPALLPSLTDIDGAVLLDLDGKCHAIGVILDGRVGVQGTIVGNRGRGARYNSAVRYAADEKCPRCLIIVRSEDGMLNFIPEEETQVAAEESVSS